MKTSLVWGLAAVLVLLSAATADAGVIVYEEGEKKIEVGGRIQLQYTRVDVDGGEAFDDLFFRRLRPYIAGTLSKDWWAKIQVDFGKSLDSDEVAIKDAYIQYKGWDGLKLTIGNSHTPFAAEILGSSKRQQLAERGFVGAHNFGTPDRQLGLSLSGAAKSKKLTWMAVAGSESHDPAVGRIDFDSPVNNHTDWNQGWVASARLDFHPMGHVKFDQADFHSDSIKLRFGLSAFTWSNDGDRNTYIDDDGQATSTSKADLDAATGIELSIALRGLGFSADVAYQIVSGETVDQVFSGGVYVDGETDLEKIMVKGGYMLPGNRFEIVGRWEELDADGYTRAWQVIEAGVNYYWNNHKTKLQVSYRLGENTAGVADAEVDTIFAQMQYVF